MKTTTFLATLLLACNLCIAQSEPVLITDFTSGQNYYFSSIQEGVQKIVLEYNDAIELYNLDFSLYKTIELPDEVQNSTVYYIYYITESMFDCDTAQIEYLVNMQQSGELKLKIFREDGSEIFYLPGYWLSNIGVLDLDVTTSTVVSDSIGTYLMFGSPPGTANRKLYRFCGQVPRFKTSSQPGAVLGAESNAVKKGFKLFPNPTDDQLRIQYDLQGHRQATMQLFDISGNMVKQVKVGQGFKEILIDTSALASGTYIVRLVTSDGVRLSEKFIKL